MIIQLRHTIITVQAMCLAETPFRVGKLPIMVMAGTELQKLRIPLGAATAHIADTVNNAFNIPPIMTLKLHC